MLGASGIQQRSDQSSKTPFLPRSLNEKLCVLGPELKLSCVVLAHRNILSHDTLPVGQGSQSPGKVRKGWGWMKDGVSADG